MLEYSHIDLFVIDELRRCGYKSARYEEEIEDWSWYYRYEYLEELKQRPRREPLAPRARQINKRTDAAHAQARAAAPPSNNKIYAPGTSARPSILAEIVGKQNLHTRKPPQPAQRHKWLIAISRPEHL